MNQPFIPIGLPRAASDNDSLDERVGLHLLEALEALDAVYKSAAFFADFGSQTSLAEYTLGGCLDLVRTTTGSLYLVDGNDLLLHGDRGGAAELLRPGLLEDRSFVLRTNLMNGVDAAPALRAGGGHNVLTSPILAGDRLLGVVVMLAPAELPFSSADAKLVAAVASQAAIALSRAQKHRDADRERQTLMLVMQNHHDGIAVLDCRGRTTLCNPITRELLGTEDVLAGLVAADPTLSLATLTRGSLHRELTCGHDGQQRLLGLEARVLRDADGGGGDVVVTLRDVTRQRRDEQLNRGFVGLISHKLRTPLAALSCGVVMLESTPPGEHPPLFADMNHRVHDLGLLIDRLSDFTDLLDSPNAGRGECDLEELRRELHEHFRARVDATDGQLVWDVPVDARRLGIPATRLRVALLNLLDNAIKFTGEHDPWVRIAARRDGDVVLVDVEDRGPGIPHSERHTVLDAFRQLEPDFTGNVPGAGIGIAMVREIARRAGGTLQLRDAEPHGCVFTLELPLAPGATP